MLSPTSWSDLVGYKLTGIATRGSARPSSLSSRVANSYLEHREQVPWLRWLMTGQQDEISADNIHSEQYSERITLLIIHSLLQAVVTAYNLGDPFLEDPFWIFFLRSEVLGVSPKWTHPSRCQGASCRSAPVPLCRSSLRSRRPEIRSIKQWW